MGSNEMAQVTFRPQQPLVVDSFKNCEGLSRIAFLDGNTAVMLGKVVSVTSKADMPAEETGIRRSRCLRRMRRGKLWCRRGCTYLTWHDSFEFEGLGHLRVDALRAGPDFIVDALRAV